MTLDDFLAETRAEIATQMSEGSPFAELVFCEVVMQHLVDVGMTFEPVICHYQGKVGNANLRLSGYAISDDTDQLDLFVSLYEGFETLTPVQDQNSKTAAQQCGRGIFSQKSAFFIFFAAFLFFPLDKPPIFRYNKARSGGKRRTNLSDHGPVAQLVRAPACHAGGRRFEPDPGRHLLL